MLAVRDPIVERSGAQRGGAVGAAGRKVPAQDDELSRLLGRLPILLVQRLHLGVEPSELFALLAGLLQGVRVAPLVESFHLLLHDGSLGGQTPNLLAEVLGEQCIGHDLICLGRQELRILGFDPLPRGDRLLDGTGVVALHHDQRRPVGRHERGIGLGRVPLPIGEPRDCDEQHRRGDGEDDGKPHLALLESKLQLHRLRPGLEGPSSRGRGL